MTFPSHRRFALPTQRWLHFRDGRPVPWAAILWIAASTGLLIPVVLAVGVSHYPKARWDSYAVVLAAALVTPFFSVKGVRQQSFILTGAVCLMGALLLPPVPVLAVPLVANTVDWVKRRYLPGNPGTLATISAFLNGITLLWATFAASEAATLAERGASPTLRGLAPLCAVVAFVFVAENGFAIFIFLSWGHSLRDLFSRETIAAELALASSGAAGAVLWLINPWYTPLVVAPIALARLVQRVPNLQVEATQDSKTRLLNSASFMAEFADEVERAQRRGLPLTLLVADLDLLREVNNRDGHLAGDSIILGFADVIRSQLRRSDLAGRFGGEEFLVLLPSTTGAEGTIIGERIRNAFAAKIMRVDGRESAVRSTVSIGLACFPQDGRSPQELLQVGDVALYEAKEKGRNQLVRAGSYPLDDLCQNSDLASA